MNEKQKVAKTSSEIETAIDTLDWGAMEYDDEDEDAIAETLMNALKKVTDVNFTKQVEDHSYEDRYYNSNLTHSYRSYIASSHLLILTNQILWNIQQKKSIMRMMMMTITQKKMKMWLQN